ncbi:MAG TPA: hypothetical protein VFP44_16635 [Usitatibacter sp.]|nr:hypothetical protein [Usitatibacter sp.]
MRIPNSQRPAALSSLVYSLMALLFLAASSAFAAGGVLLGKTLTRIPGGDNFANRAVVQPDGKVVIAGAAHFGSRQYQITRYNADGSLDAPFGISGTILEPLGAGDGAAWAIALQPDGKIVVAGNVRSDKDRFGLARFNPDGTLDLSFGGGGSAKSAGPGDSGAFAMAIQPDGKIVLGGYSMTAASGGRKVFTVARYNADDTLDTTFGSNGFAIAPAGASDEVIRSIGIQADGRIVAAGPAASGGTRLMRFNANGTIDGTWATPSVAYTNGGNDMVMQSDGRIAIVVGVNGGGVGEVGVLRLNADGTVDTSFGNGNCAFGPCPGVAHMSISDSVTGYGLALQSGKYVVSGDTIDGAGRPGVAIGRFTSTGASDTTFGAGGSSNVVRPTGSGDAGRGLALRPDGRIVVAGLANGNFGDFDSLAVAFTANGQLDTTFNGTGFSRLDVGSMAGEWRSTALQPDGKIVAAGFTIAESHTASPGVRGGVVGRFLANGTLDASFGTGGLTRFTWPANAVALQSDGKVVVGGYSLTGSPAKPSMTFGRFNPDGSVDSTFGSGGTFAIAPATSDEEINSIALDASGRIVGAGFTTGGFLDSVFVRLTGAGALDTTFNGSGRVAASMSTGSDVVNAVAIQADGKIVGAGWADVSSSQDSISLTRVNADGSIDTGFGTAGVANVNFGTATSNGYALVIQPDARIVVAGKVFNASSTTDDFAIARLLATGAPDASFGTNGRMSSDFGNHNRIFALARLPDGRLLGAGETGGLFALVQYLSSGVLDIGFGNNGSTSAQINAGNDFANAVTVGLDGTIYAAGNGSGVLALARFGDQVSAGADVGVTQAASPNPGTAGQNLTFTITASNAGPAAATNVVVTDTLPAGVAFVSASAGCSNASGKVTCSVGSLAAGASAQLTIVVQPSSGGTITNDVSISAAETDPAAANNATSVSVTINGAPAPGTGNTLLGLSTRMDVLTGDNVLIGGFVIGGASPKTVVVRARGPSLGVAGALGDPTLTLVPADGSTPITNDDWGSAANAAQVQASGFAPADAKESAILVTLNPGAYTAIVSGVGNTTGVAIVEIFEVDHPEVPLSAISTRGDVLTGDNVMIGGFIIPGSAPRTVVVRARGPSLASSGVAGALADPTLTLVPADGSTPITNDDWGSAANAAQLQASGFAPADAKESAILVTLNPGAYTAVVSGVGGATGVSIVEIFAVP